MDQEASLEFMASLIWSEASLFSCETRSAESQPILPSQEDKKKYVDGGGILPKKKKSAKKKRKVKMRVGDESSRAEKVSEEHQA
jgi:hypothetical protein